ncbi:MAG: diphosphomevalonate decarboxylase [Gammaproteobacteria bacterium]|nr:diphosphomevalonate decarboxylase [Gammaproteobacteria bacterium]
MQASAQAQPNVALVKYWGKRDTELNIPAVASLSVTLDALWTRTRVTFDPALDEDVLRVGGQSDTPSNQVERTTRCLDQLRRLAGIDTRAHIDTENNFPTGAGLASSASGFAALVTAGAEALGLKLTAAQRSALARQSSGSAARSIFGGFVELDPDSGALNGTATPLLAPEAWRLEVTIAVTSKQPKALGSTDGMNLTARTSDYYDAWVGTARGDLHAARRAVAERDFDSLARVSERSCLKMHGLMLSADPGLIYWNGVTVECIREIRALRHAGVPVFFTIDAGPQVKAISLPGAAAQVRDALRTVPGVLDVMHSGLGQGARLVPEGPCG